MAEEGSGYEVLGVIPELDNSQTLLRCRSCGTLLLYSDQEIHEFLHTKIDEALNRRNNYGDADDSPVTSYDSGYWFAHRINH
jgi:hypothetical protein